jgi:1-acyl-sn-glycerol-3-phosphate acyltransferase
MSTTVALTSKPIPTQLAGPAPYVAAFALCLWLIGSFILNVHEPQNTIIPHREHVEWGLCGAAIGMALCLFFAHPTRMLGFIPWGGLLWVILLPIEGPLPWCRTLAFLAGMAAACILLPMALTAWRRLGRTGHYRFKVTQNDIAMSMVLMFVFGFCLFLFYGQGITPRTHFWFWWGLHVAMTLAAFVLLRRPGLEWLGAGLMIPMYRLRALGPGKDKVPWEGPLLLVANHAAWMDPFWLGKVVPRHHTPMMTSTFYDLPGVRPIMKYILNVIRVQYDPGRKEVPELQEAIARLDRGEAVLIFPEGTLRRKEEMPLLLFGQGVWHILKERPDTPVVCCWIEGNWGSYFSAKDGEPTKNKKFDWFRKITVMIGEAKPVPPEILADRKATRRYLMDRVLELRTQVPGFKPDEKAVVAQDA